MKPNRHLNLDIHGKIKHHKPKTEPIIKVPELVSPLVLLNIKEWQALKIEIQYSPKIAHPSPISRVRSHTTPQDLPLL